MTRSIRGARRAAAVLAGTATAATLLLSGCGAGQIAETAAKIPTSVGTNAQSADNLFKVRNLSIDYLNPQGYPAGADAPMNVALFNDSDKAVTVRVSTTGARAVVLAGGSAGTGSPAPSPEATQGGPSPEATATPGGPSPEATPGGTPTATPTEGATPAPTASPTQPGEVQLPAAGFVILNKTAGSWLQLSGLTEPLTPGGNIELVFDFGGTQVSVWAPVAVPASPAPVGSPVVGENTEHE